jgi:hypothetical protein
MVAGFPERRRLIFLALFRRGNHTKFKIHSGEHELFPGFAVYGIIEKLDGFRNPRVMLDYVAEYWTVVLESEVDSLERFESHMADFSSRPEIREALTGYMELVEEGGREIYKIV